MVLLKRSRIFDAPGGFGWKPSLRRK